MRKLLITATALTVGISLSACTFGHHPYSDHGSHSNESQSQERETTDAQSGPKGPVRVDGLEVGETAVLSDVELTVFEVVDVPHDADDKDLGKHPHKDSQWVAVDHETCVSEKMVPAEGGIFLHNDPWFITSTDNHRFRVINREYEEFPTPAYVVGSERVDPGECVRGWTVFDVNPDVTINTVVYKNTEGDTASWVIDTEE